MEIMKAKNYKTFADFLTKKTGCDVFIRIIGTNHYHYQISRNGSSLGVLCIDKGSPSFCPFRTLDTAKNNQYVNIRCTPTLEGLGNYLRHLVIYMLIENLV